MKRNILITTILTLLFSTLFISCENSQKDSGDNDLTIFFINDSHSQIDNFSKIKYIVDQEEKEKKSNNCKHG